MRSTEGRCCPSSNKPIYFLKILDYHIPHQQGFLGAVTFASLRWGQKVRIIHFGPAPQDFRLISGGVPPETRAGQNLSTFFFCTTPIKFIDHLSGVPA
jgi:hypothetical protein